LRAHRVAVAGIALHTILASPVWIAPACIAMHSPRGMKYMIAKAMGL
jgi:hypothetical protein